MCCAVGFKLSMLKSPHLNVSSVFLPCINYKKYVGRHERLFRHFFCIYLLLKLWIILINFPKVNQNYHVMNAYKTLGPWEDLNYVWWLSMTSAFFLMSSFFFLHGFCGHRHCSPSFCHLSSRYDGHCDVVLKDGVPSLQQFHLAIIE